MRRPGGWRQAVMAAGACLPAAIIGVVILTGADESADEWGPLAAVALVALAVWLWLYLAGQSRSR
jgi:hypothetical protein